ncbi:UNVERIFIED_CONTAM: hypothetical protein Sangu_0059200 [Sesamum angustifolium]|uniref:Uncharacterized protein n=1 Tax=Sesamum angustifolium TaxID=2727405 RepID=A0AAW2RIX4_9LAMI
MEMEDSITLPSASPRNPFSQDPTSGATFTPSDDNFLLNSPYLHRLIHHLTTTTAAANPRSNPAPKSSIEALQEVTITLESDPTMLCPVFCRFKLPAAEEETEENGEEGYVGSVRLEELVDDEVDLYGFRNTLRHIARRHRWNEEGHIGSGSEGNLLSPTQIGEVERGDGVLERENSVETVSSLPRWPVEERRGGSGGNDGTDAFARS